MSGSPLRVLLVDDEQLARTLLREHLAAHPEVEIVGEATNGFEAVKLAAELRPDLLLLDIQMPKLSGFEVLELLADEAPPVVFVTAHDEHALRAFAVHAVDYLLKPVEPERLAAALARTQARRRARAGEAAARPEVAAEALAASARPPGRPLERILFREGAQIVVLPVDRIDFVEAQDDYLSFAAGGRRHRRQQTLQELEPLLDPARFVRVHRSYLLNVERLARLDLYARDSAAAVLADGTRIPVSRSGQARLRQLLG
jgi:two-component system LytT family response regulator